MLLWSLNRKVENTFHKDSGMVKVSCHVLPEIIHVLYTNRMQCVSIHGPYDRVTTDCDTYLVV